MTISGTPSNPQDVAQLEKQAQLMLQSSASGYGTYVDPQLATEALLTGAAPAVSSTLAEGDPALQSALLSQPVGASQFQRTGTPPPTSLFGNPYTFDPKQYQDYVSKSKSDGLNNSFESMNEAPMANRAWYDHILQGDNGTIKKWQQFLADRGFYGTFDQNGKMTQKGEVNGYNTQDFQKALTQWSVAYFLPQSLFSRDQQELTNSRMFLSSLGVDPNAIASSMSHDPQQRLQVIDGWLQAQGPDGNKMDRLNSFADHFGAAALPDQLNKVRGDGMFGSIGNFLGHIPGVGNLLGTTPEQLDAKLTPAEQEVLAPALQNAHDQSGFLGFLGDVFSAPSKALVTTGLFFGHAVQGDVENPFDAGSTVRHQADDFVANPIKDMFGADFAAKNPWLTTIGNFAVNIADDPMTLIPFVGSTHLMGDLAKGIEGFSDMTDVEKSAALSQQMGPLERATGGLISHRVGALRTETMPFMRPITAARLIKNDGLKATLTRALDPLGSAQQDVAKMVTDKNMTLGQLRDIIGEVGDDPEAKGRVSQLMKHGQSGDSNAVLDFLRDPKNGYAHNMFDLSYLSNRNQYAKVLKNFDRLSQGKALHVWHVSAMGDIPNLVNLDKTSDSVSAGRNAAMAAGMEVGDIQAFENAMWNSEQGLQRSQIWQGFNKQLEDHLNQKWSPEGATGKEGIDQYAEWRAKFRNGGIRTQNGSKIFDIEHDPKLKAINNSWRNVSKIRFVNDAEDGTTAEQLNAHADELKDALASKQAHFQSSLDGAARSLHPNGALTPELQQQALSDPIFKGEFVQHQRVMADLSNELKDMQEKYGGKQASSRMAAPIQPTQSFQWEHLKYTASEIMAYSHPKLRKMSSVQNTLGINRAMSLWKKIVLSKPSTLARVIFGDETSRFHINLLLNDPKTWGQYVAHQLAVHGKNLDTIDLPDDLASQVIHMSHSNIHKFIPMDPGEKGYGDALQGVIKNHYSQNEAYSGWLKAIEDANKSGKDEQAAGLKSITQWLKGNSQQAKTMRETRDITNVKKNSNQLDDLAATMHHDISSFVNHDFSNPDRMEMFNWVKSGKVDKSKLKELEDKYAEAPEGQYVLPRTQARPPFLSDGQGLLGQTLDHYHQWANERITRARARGWMFKMKSENARLKKFYSQVNADGTQVISNERINDMAKQSASNWVKKNTYQGARSAAASSLRNVAPFWGATANSDRFYLHTLIEHPEIAVPVAQGEQAISEQQQKGGFRVNVPLAGQLLSKVGLSAGDEFTFDPFNALFLTREGLGGFIPGMGPVFNVMMQGADALHPGFTDFASMIPGMQYAKSGTPMLPWLESIASGALLMTGHEGLDLPIVGRGEGYYEKQTDSKLQQLEADWQQGGRKGPAPTVQDAERDQGVNRMITGVAGFAAPIGLASEDSRKTDILNAEQTWDPALSSTDKQTFYQQNQNVADYFKYNDPTIPEQAPEGQESKQAILARSPWVLAYSTGTGVTNIPGRATLADTQNQYKLDVQEGNISTMAPTAYLTKVRQQEETTQAWNEFDRLQSAYQNYLQTAGVTSSSPEAKEWRKQNYDAPLNSLVTTFPDWGQTFVKQTSRSQTGLEFASEPFYSVSTFQVIPQNPALETKATVLWRAALQRRDQAVSALNQILAQHGPQVEKDMVLQGLAQELDGLAAQDPKFKAQISRYRYANINDLITFQANQELLQQQGYPT